MTQDPIVVGLLLTLWLVLVCTVVVLVVRKVFKKDSDFIQGKVMLVDDIPFPGFGLCRAADAWQPSNSGKAPVPDIWHFQQLLPAVRLTQERGEAATIVKLTWQSGLAGEYQGHGVGMAVRPFCTVEIIDAATSTVRRSRRFAGGDPPASVTVRRGQRRGDQAGALPLEAVEGYLRRVFGPQA